MPWSCFYIPPYLAARCTGSPTSGASRPPPELRAQCLNTPPSNQNSENPEVFIIIISFDRAIDVDPSRVTQVRFPACSRWTDGRAHRDSSPCPTKTRGRRPRLPLAHAQKLTQGLSMGFHALKNVGRAGEVFALRFRPRPAVGRARPRAGRGGVDEAKNRL